MFFNVIHLHNFSNFTSWRAKNFSNCKNKHRYTPYYLVRQKFMLVPLILSPAYSYRYQNSPNCINQCHFLLNSLPAASSLHIRRASVNFSHIKNGSILLPSYLTKLKNTHLGLTVQRRPCLSNSDHNTNGLSDATNLEGSAKEEESKMRESLTSNEILKKLRRYGLSGILSYGILNTAYYLTTFLFVWFYIAPAPGKIGYLAAVERFLKVMAMVWTGSQVTKLLRAGGALTMAPFVDRGLSWFTVKFKFESQGKAFMAIVGCCFGLVFILFLVITLLWA